MKSQINQCYYIIFDFKYTQIKASSAALVRVVHDKKKATNSTMKKTQEQENS